jgi:hypothetical protein
MFEGMVVQMGGSLAGDLVQLLGRMTIATIPEAEIGICTCGLSNRSTFLTIS